MTEAERAFLAQCAALGEPVKAWAAHLLALRDLFARLARAYTVALARADGRPMRKGRIVWHAHQRTHWGRHG